MCVRRVVCMLYYKYFPKYFSYVVKSRPHLDRDDFRAYDMGDADSYIGELWNSKVYCFDIIYMCVCV